MIGWDGLMIMCIIWRALHVITASDSCRQVRNSPCRITRSCVRPTTVSRSTENSIQRTEVREHCESYFSCCWKWRIDYIYFFKLKTTQNQRISGWGLHLRKSNCKYCKRISISTQIRMVRILSALLTLQVKDQSFIRNTIDNIYRPIRSTKWYKCFC